MHWLDGVLYYMSRISTSQDQGEVNRILRSFPRKPPPGLHTSENGGVGVDPWTWGGMPGTCYFCPGALPVVPESRPVYSQTMSGLDSHFFGPFHLKDFMIPNK